MRCVGSEVGDEGLPGFDGGLDELEAAVADLRGLVPLVHDVLGAAEVGDPDGAVGPLLEVAGLVVAALLHLHHRGPNPVKSIRYALRSQTNGDPLEFAWYRKKSTLDKGRRSPRYRLIPFPFA